MKWIMVGNVNKGSCVYTFARILASARKNDGLHSNEFSACEFFSRCLSAAV